MLIALRPTFRNVVPMTVGPLTGIYVALICTTPAAVPVTKPAATMAPPLKATVDTFHVV